MVFVLQSEPATLAKIYSTHFVRFLAYLCAEEEIKSGKTSQTLGVFLYQLFSWGHYFCTSLFFWRLFICFRPGFINPPPHPSEKKTFPCPLQSVEVYKFHSGIHSSSIAMLCRSMNPSATRRALQGAFVMTASAIGPKRSAQSRSAHGPNPLPILSRTREIVHDVRDLTPRTRAGAAVMD